MAEYIDKNELDIAFIDRCSGDCGCCPHWNSDGLEYDCNLIHNFPPANVVERSKYNELARVNKALQERVTFLESNRPCRDCGSSPIGEYADLENENKYFREKMAKIDKAIEEMTRLFDSTNNIDLENRTYECIEILKRNIGEEGAQE